MRCGKTLLDLQEAYRKHFRCFETLFSRNGPRGAEYRKHATIDPGTGTQTGAILRWNIYDGLGSVISEVDGNGNVTATQLYDAFGAVNASTGSSTSKQKFCGSLGHTTEPDMGGLVYMRARWYDPAVGRFISEDPAGQGANWYIYCNNNPVNATDPTGMFTFGDVWADVEGLATEMRQYMMANNVKNYIARKVESVVMKWSIEFGFLLTEVAEMGLDKSGQGFTIAQTAGYRIMIHASGHANGEGPHIQLWYNATCVAKVFFSELGKKQ